ncbi:hypothetical protein EDB83DRAFT_2313419 [Lactarius deliciosus]|nr:hypothetical protein EDB83DRAFT_2313419 [Lactarius deliciosus]
MLSPIPLAPPPSSLLLHGLSWSPTPQWTVRPLCCQPTTTPRGATAPEFSSDSAHLTAAKLVSQPTQLQVACAVDHDYDLLHADTTTTTAVISVMAVTTTRQRNLKTTTTTTQPQSANSLAVWRRKVAVSNSVCLSHLREIELAKAALQKDYPDDNPVLVDEIRLTVTKTTARSVDVSTIPKCAALDYSEKTTIVSKSMTIILWLTTTTATRRLRQQRRDNMAPIHTHHQ